jgi:transporter family-2 protein
MSGAVAPAAPAEPEHTPGPPPVAPLSPNMRRAVSAWPVALGVCAVCEGGASAALGHALGLQLLSSLYTFLVGSTLLALLCLALNSHAAGRLTAPLAWSRRPAAWELTGGVLDAVYVAALVYAIPVLGFSLFFVLVVAGQLVCAVALESRGALGLPRVPLSLRRAAPVALALAAAGLSSAETLRSDTRTHGAAGTYVVACIGALAGGAALPVQAGVNGHLASALPGRLHAALVSFLGGALVVALVAGAVVAGVGSSVVTLDVAPAWWAFFGAPLGIAYVVSAVFVPPRLGVAQFMVSLLAGELLAGLVFDDVGLLTDTRVAATPLRIVGTALACVAGAALELLAARPAAGCAGGVGDCGAVGAKHVDAAAVQVALLPKEPTEAA